jgi:hypothetical protein
MTRNRKRTGETKVRLNLAQRREKTQLTLLAMNEIKDLLLALREHVFN